MNQQIEILSRVTEISKKEPNAYILDLKTKIKNSLEGLNSRFNMAQERISDRLVETIQTEEQRSVGQHQVCHHPSSGSSTKRGEREESRKIFEKIITENITNLSKNINLHIQESQSTPGI